jgi:hypothetical protein
MPPCPLIQQAGVSGRRLWRARLSDLTRSAMLARNQVPGAIRLISRNHLPCRSYQLMTPGREPLVTLWIRAAIAFTILCCGTAMAQQPPAQQSQQPAAEPPVVWERLPRMLLQQQYAGPLKDTLIQRWRDPETNLICYVYLPITAAHSAPTPNSYVQYGPNVIGSISCVSPPAEATRPTAAARPAPAAKPSHPQPPHNEPNPANQ